VKNHENLSIIFDKEFGQLLYTNELKNGRFYLYCLILLHYIEFVRSKTSML